VRAGRRYREFGALLHFELGRGEQPSLKSSGADSLRTRVDKIRSSVDRSTVEAMSFRLGKKELDKLIRRVEGLKRHIEVGKAQLDADRWASFISRLRSEADASMQAKEIVEKDYANDIRRAQALRALAQQLGFDVVKSSGKPSSRSTSVTATGARGRSYIDFQSAAGRRGGKGGAKGREREQRVCHLEIALTQAAG
jgi:hypothetical protein